MKAVVPQETSNSTSAVGDLPVSTAGPGGMTAKTSTDQQPGTSTLTVATMTSTSTQETDEEETQLRTTHSVLQTSDQLPQTAPDQLPPADDSRDSSDLSPTIPIVSTSQPARIMDVKPVEHLDKVKAHWSLNIKQQTQTVVIADSNFRMVKKLPADWEVHVYPGMSLIQARNLVASSSCLNTNRALKNIIVSVGINNRGWSFNNVLPDINKLFISLERTDRAGYFVGVSIPPRIPETEKDVIRKLNDHAKQRFGSYFINELAPDEVSVCPKDKYKIHYDQDTLDKICLGITNHFLSLTAFGHKPNRLSL